MASVAWRGWLVSLVLAIYIAVDKAHLARGFWPWAPSLELRLSGSDSTENVSEHNLGNAGASNRTSWPHFDIATLSEFQHGRPASAASVVQRLLGQTSSSQSEAMCFLLVTIFFGTAVTHMMWLPSLHSLQPSVVLFLLGILYSLTINIFKYTLDMDIGVGIRSYEMWMDIDPHLMLFSMLPALLTGDAMTLDTSVARRVAKQCIYLASVGVLTCTALTALFLKVYLAYHGYDWDPLLCVTTGAILCATDPVAVVALLKELGASPTLTVQIQGESLLNDGTAIVLYTIAYSMLQGVTYDFSDIMIFLVQKVACALGLGMVIGYVFLYWIQQVGSNWKHEEAGMIQTVLTICCAYWSFIFAEGVLHINGVLATVASALVLAHMMWPAIVNKEAMHTIWHVLEYLGNTLIFVLAGALTGRAAETIAKVSLQDYLHVFVIYMVLTVIRFLMLYLSRPVLRVLSEEKQPVTLAEVIVMTWGGLRGAVGLALAIQVTIDRADGQIDEMDANRVLFYVGGVATLTLVVNATTCPMIVKRLGITQLADAKRKMLLLMHRRLLETSNAWELPVAVSRSIHQMLDVALTRIQMHPGAPAMCKDSVIALEGGFQSEGGRFSADQESEMADGKWHELEEAPKALERRLQECLQPGEEESLQDDSRSPYNSSDPLPSPSIDPARSDGQDPEVLDETEDVLVGSASSLKHGDTEVLDEAEDVLTMPDALHGGSASLLKQGGGMESRLAMPDEKHGGSASSYKRGGSASSDYDNDAFLGASAAPAQYVQNDTKIRDNGSALSMKKWQEAWTEATSMGSVETVVSLQRDSSRLSSRLRAGSSKGSGPPGTSASFASVDALYGLLEKVEDFFIYLKAPEPTMHTNQQLIDEFEEVKRTFELIPNEQMEIVDEMLMTPWLDQHDEMVVLLAGADINETFLNTMNDGFLSLVKSYYLKVIESSLIKPGSPEADVLLSSIVMALTTSHKDLYDFHYVLPFVKRKFSTLGTVGLHSEEMRNFNDGQSGRGSLKVGAMNSLMGKQRCCKRISLKDVVASLTFTIIMVVAILANAICMFVEEEVRDASNNTSPVWLGSDITFTAIFLIECALKLKVSHLRYFLDPWNAFDFCLVVLGVVGVCFNALSVGIADYSSEGRLVRIARVFRVMRLIRLFRLWRLIRGVRAIVFKKEYMLQAQDHIQKMTVLMNFARAHIHAQHEFVNYFGTHGKIDVAEVIRPVLQSQISVYRAISLLVCEEHMLGREVHGKVSSIRENEALALEIEKFVMDAHEEGVLSSRDVKHTLQPLHKYMQDALLEIRTSMKETARKSFAVRNTVRNRQQEDDEE